MRYLDRVILIFPTSVFVDLFFSHLSCKYFGTYNYIKLSRVCISIFTYALVPIKNFEFSDLNMHVPVTSRMQQTMPGFEYGTMK